MPIALTRVIGIKEHSHHPYPTEQEKVDMMDKTGMNLKQINNWYVVVYLIISRKRYDKL